MNIKEKVRNRIVDDWRALHKKWSIQITGLMISAQVVWAAVPSEARSLLPRPEYIGIGLGLAALIAMTLKQGKSDAGE